MTDKLSKLDLQPNSVVVLTVDTTELPREQAAKLLQDATTSLAATQAKDMGHAVLVCESRIIVSALTFAPGDTLIFKVDPRGLTPVEGAQYMSHVANSMEAGFPDNKVLTIPYNTDLEVERKVFHMDLGSLTDVDIATVLSNLRDEMDRRQFGGIIENSIH